MVAGTRAAGNRNHHGPPGGVPAHANKHRSQGLLGDYPANSGGLGRGIGRGQRLAQMAASFEEEERQQQRQQSRRTAEVLRGLEQALT